MRKRHEANQERKDYRAALICAVVANAAPREKGSKAFTPDDFMPRPAALTQQTPEQMLENLKTITLACGGTIVEV